MKYSIKILWLICIYSTSVLSQQVNEIPLRKLVEVPREITLQVSVLRPDCPIKFEDVHFFVGVEGGGGINSYRLRNVGTKPIRSVTVASSNGAGATYFNNGNVLIMPGQLMPEQVCVNCRKDEIVPLSDELRDKLKLKGSMRSIVFLIVVEVEFMDGTKYSDKTAFDAMTEFLEKLDDAIYEQKQRAVKRQP